MKRFLLAILLLVVFATGAALRPPSSLSQHLPAEAPPQPWSVSSVDSLKVSPADPRVVLVRARVVQILLDRGAAFIQEESYDAAIEEYSGVLEIDPANSEAYFYRGYCYRQKKWLHSAVLNFSEAIRLKPQPLYYLSRCNAHLAGENAEEAIRDCSETIRRVPARPEAYLLRGLAYWLQGDLDRALQDSLMALMIQPESPPAKQLLEQILLQRENSAAGERGSSRALTFGWQPLSSPNYRTKLDSSTSLLSVGSGRE